MNDDLEAILKEGSLQETLTKIAKLSEESTMSANKHAWLVDSLENRFVIEYEYNPSFESHRDYRRPPGDITKHLRSLDAHKIKEATEELEKRVNEMERENETLMRTIVESRSRIRTRNDNVTRILNRAPIMLQRLENTCEQLSTCLKMIENE